MSGRNRRAFLGTAGALLALPWLTGCQRDLPPSGPQPGEQFPQFALPDLQGRMVDLGTTGSQALLLNFWASWCGPCREEMPSLQRLSRLFDPSQLRVVGISVDDDLNLVREFLLRYRIDFAVLADQHQRIARDTLHIPLYPSTYLIGPGRRVARLIVGEQEWTAEPMLRELELAAGIHRQQPAG